MPRIRNIKPEFWTNERLSALPESTHLLAAALLNYADDEGYFNANVGLIKAACFPLREPSVKIPESLRSLQSIGYLRLGVGADGRAYGHVVEFLTHQRVSHPSPSKIKGLPVQWDALHAGSGGFPSGSGGLQSMCIGNGDGKGDGKGEGGSTPDGVLVAGKPDDETGGDLPSRPKIPPCPVERIVAAYHDQLPMLATVRVVSDKTRKALQTRWREDPDRQTVEWWRDFFGYVATCPWLVGGRSEWTADFAWLVLPTNFEKVINGRYDQKQ